MKSNLYLLLNKMKGFKEVSSLSPGPLELDSQTWGYTFIFLSSVTRGT